MFKKARSDKIKECLDLPFFPMILDYDYYFYGELEKTFRFHHLSAIGVISNTKVVIGDNGSLFIKDLISETTELIGFPLFQIVSIVVFSDGRIASAADKTIQIWKKNSEDKWEKQYKLKRPTKINCLAILPGDKLISGSQDGYICFWINDKLEDFVQHDNKAAVYDIKVISDRKIVTCGENDYLEVWRHNGTQWIYDYDLNFHEKRVQCIDAFPDGRIISASKDGTYIIWNHRRIKCRINYGKINALAVLPSNQIAIGHFTGVNIWDDTIKYKDLDTDKNEVTILHVLPDGRLISGTSNSKVMIWN